MKTYLFYRLIVHHSLSGKDTYTLEETIDKHFSGIYRGGSTVESNWIEPSRQKTLDCQQTNVAYPDFLVLKLCDLLQDKIDGELDIRVDARVEQVDQFRGTRTFTSKGDKV